MTQNRIYQVVGTFGVSYYFAVQNVSVILCTATRNVRPTMPFSDTRGLPYNEFTNTNCSYHLIHVSSLSLPKDTHNVDRGCSVWGYYLFARFIQATVAPIRKQLIFIITQEFPFLLRLYFWFCLTIQLSASLEACCTHEFSPMIHSSSQMNNNKSCQNTVLFILTVVMYDDGSEVVMA